jgi:putative endonuclease
MPDWVYIPASRRNGTLYVGVTNDLSRRVWQHKQGIGAAFTKRYGVTRLVHISPFDRIDDAIAHEKRLKRWHRSWKLRLIEEQNPGWHDLYDTLNR